MYGAGVEARFVDKSGAREERRWQVGNASDVRRVRKVVGGIQDKNGQSFGVRVENGSTEGDEIGVRWRVKCNVV